jgi:hypothetical protein
MKSAFPPVIPAHSWPRHFPKNLTRQIIIFALLCGANPRIAHFEQDSLSARKSIPGGESFHPQSSILHLLWLRPCRVAAFFTNKINLHDSIRHTTDAGVAGVFWFPAVGCLPGCPLPGDRRAMPETSATIC